MLTDFKTQIHDRLWALIEAEPEVTSRVLVGNRQKLTQQAGWVKKLFTGAAPADYPLISISPGRFTNSLFLRDPTFAMEGSAFGAGGEHFPVVRVADFTIIVSSRTLLIGEMDQLEEAVQQAIIKGGPKLGIANCSTWGPLTASQEATNRDDSKGTWRLVTKMRVPVTLEIDGQTFIGA